MIAPSAHAPPRLTRGQIAASHLPPPRVRDKTDRVPPGTNSLGHDNARTAVRIHHHRARPAIQGDGTLGNSWCDGVTILNRFLHVLAVTKLTGNTVLPSRPHRQP